MAKKEVEGILKNGILLLRKVNDLTNEDLKLEYLRSYPTNSTELIKKLVKENNRKELLKLAVYTNDRSVLYGLFSENISSKTIDAIADKIAQLPDYKVINNDNDEFDVDEMKNAIENKIELEAFYSNGKDLKSMLKNIKEDNLKETAIDLVVILEKKLNLLGYVEDDLSENINCLFDDLVSDDDESQEYLDHMKDLLHRLRIMRNNFVHGKLTKGDPLNKKEMQECAKYIFEGMDYEIVDSKTKNSDDEEYDAEEEDYDDRFDD